MWLLKQSKEVLPTTRCAGKLPLGNKAKAVISDEWDGDNEIPEVNEPSRLPLLLKKLIFPLADAVHSVVPNMDPFA